MARLNRTFIKHAGCGFILCCIIAGCGAASPSPVESQTARPVASPTPEQQQRACPPQGLQRQMEELARVTGGPVGAAVMLVETGDVVAFNGARQFPMQSVYKLPIAMAVLGQVDSGALKLEQKVQVRVEDLVPTRAHSPIRDSHPRGVELSLRELLRYAVSESDGTASDVLMRVVGGPERVMNYLRELGVEGILVANTEKELSQDEQVQYRNWATPESMLALLRLLQEGRGLSAESRSLLLELMVTSVPGPRRIKGLLPQGTIVAHKTGTSGTVDGLTRATNDVGIITLPDGRHLAVAVFVSDTKEGANVREGVIAKIARAAWDCWTGK